MELVNEEDDGALGGLDLRQEGLEALLELTPKLCPGHQRSEVERQHLLVLQALRNIPHGDALRDAFDDGGLSDAGFTDQHRVVLGSAAQH